MIDLQLLYYSIYYPTNLSTSITIPKLYNLKVQYRNNFTPFNQIDSFDRTIALVVNKYTFFY